MEFLPKREWARRLRLAQVRRRDELVALGIPRALAQRQTFKEFGVYDRLEIDRRGWIRMADLTLPPD